MCSNVKPGGWVELQDFDLDIQSDNDNSDDAPPSHSNSGSNSDLAVFQWVKIIIETAKSIERDPSPGPGLEGWMQAAGFIDVTHRVFKIPLGGWPEDPELQEIGYLYLAQTLEGMEGFSLRLMCGVLGWDLERVRELLARVRKDLMTRRLRLKMDL